jgi:glycerol-3-phosphate dehydrogenase
LTNEVVQQGVHAGGIAINYTEVKTIISKESKTESIVCFDVLNQKELVFKGNNFVSATGVWTDNILNLYEKQSKQFMKPSKGVHIVVSGDFFPKDTVLILPSVEGDGRFIWSVPWEDNLCVIGTTDTDYSENIDEIKTSKDEVNYLINAVNKYLIDAPLTEEHILSVYAGLRPLLNDFEEDKGSTSRSRDYETWWVNDNFLCIAGGKLTSFLSMADHVITDFSKNITVFNPVENQAKILKGLKSDLPTYPTYQILRGIYGDVNTKLIKNIVDEADNNALQLDIKYRYLVAEIIFFIRYQHAVTLDDIFTRRTLISYNMKDWDEKLIKNVCNICVGELGWSDQEVKEHISLYRNNWELMHRWN